MFGEDEIIKGHSPRARWIAVIVLACFFILGLRLFYLQVYKGDLFYRYSVNNKIRKEVLPSPRGMIFSRKSKLLVNNVPRFDAIMIPQFVKDRQELITKMSAILGMTEKEIQKVLKRNGGQARYRPITIKKNISPREVAIMETEAEKIPGMRVSTFISRDYLDSEVGAHTLGYISEISQVQLPKYRRRDKFNYKLGDFIGQSGIEEFFDNILRGIDGQEILEVDARGRMRRVLEDNNLYKDIKNLPVLPGNNIRLTLDRDIQLAAYKALEDKVGSAVAIDVRTGDVLAMVSRPSFDPSKFSTKLTTNYWNSIIKNENRPLRDRSIQEHYAPGSTFKTITAIAALEEKIINKDTTFDCAGKLRLGRRNFHCWKKSGHGKTDVVKALKESCDVFFYQIAKKLSIDKLADYARAFGVGSRTGIDLKRETTGLMPDSDWKEKRFGRPWQGGETLGCAIGQSYVLMTPIQLAVAYAAIANEGKILKPNLIKEVFSVFGEINQKSSPKVKSEINISKETFKIVKEGLFSVVNEKGGTAYWYRPKNSTMAGKTGTSQVKSFSAEDIYKKCEDREYKSRHHGIFSAYAPVEKPEIAISVIVEHGCHGSSAAAPVARAIVDEYFKNKTLVSVE
jgi:penicillin-binding protein 2